MKWHSRGGSMSRLPGWQRRSHGYLRIESPALKGRAATTLAEEELEDKMPVLNKCVPGDTSNQCL